MSNAQPQCEDCGKFIPYDRATINGKLEGPPCVGWVEWWEGKCKKCDAAAMKEGKDA